VGIKPAVEELAGCESVYQERFDPKILSTEFGANGPNE
jgi:hypothetical protein